MSSATTEFFEALDRRGHEPLLEKAAGLIRFDIVDHGKTQRWLVAIDHGDLHVSHRNAAGDCRIRAERSVFERVVTGRLNVMAAVLRGAIRIEGDVRLLALARRLVSTRAGGEP